MSATIGSIIGAGLKGIIATVGSLTVPQAFAVGALIGGIAYTFWVKYKAAKKMTKKAKKAETVTQKINMDKLDRDMEEIRTRDERETDRIYKDILDEIDEGSNIRNRGKNHRYTKKNAKRDFAAVDRMKKRKKNGSNFARTIDEEIEKFYRDCEDIYRAEEEKKFGRFIGEDDDFHRQAVETYKRDQQKFNPSFV